MENLLPENSKEKYLLAYQNFIQWQNTKNTASFSENVLMAYFQELSSNYKPSSLWCIYSMLKSTVRLKNGVDLKTYSNLLLYLKRLSDGYRSKKSKVLLSEDVEKFIKDAPDIQYLATKVALIFGVTGACGIHELTNITLKDIENHGQMLVVHIPIMKNKMARSFTIDGLFYEIVKKYESLRSPKAKTERFFLNYQNGKCTSQPIGVNKFGAMPKEIAKFLGLPNPESYTGHSFRRTSATLLADSGADIMALKHHGGWRSSHVARSYVEDSIQNKKEICTQITKLDTEFLCESPSTVVEQRLTQASNIVHTFEESTSAIDEASSSISQPVAERQTDLPSSYFNLPQAQVTAKNSNSSQQANERQQPGESSRATRPPKHGVQDHDYHQPTSSSQQARIPPPSTGPTEQCDQLPESKEIIFNVYHFLQDEYKSLKQFAGETCDLSPLAHILGRTAEATGVSEETVCRILRERKRPRHVKGDKGETKRLRLSQTESVSSPIEQDTRSSISTDSNPNADDIAETNEDENETGTLKLKFEVDEEYSEAGRKRLVMTIDPLTAQPTSTGHRIPSPEYIQMEKECEIKMDPDEVVHIQSTSSVPHELSPTHLEVKLEPCDTRSQQSTSSVHVVLSPTQPEVKLEPSDTQSQPENRSLTLDITPVFSDGDHFSRGAVLTISNPRRKKSD